MKRALPGERRLGPSSARLSLPPPKSKAGPSSAPRSGHEPPRRREVDKADLARLELITELLKTLNDPRASAAKIARHVSEIEVLAARIEDRFVQRKGGPAPKLAEQIALLGNRELEGILFTLLEDVVTLHSELSDEDVAAACGVERATGGGT